MEAEVSRRGAEDGEGKRLNFMQSAAISRDSAAVSRCSEDVRSDGDCLHKRSVKI